MIRQGNGLESSFHFGRVLGSYKGGRKLNKGLINGHECLSYDSAQDDPCDNVTYVTLVDGIEVHSRSPRQGGHCDLYKQQFN